MASRASSHQVMLFLPSLGGGGAEMNALRVLNYGDWEVLEPHLVLARQGGAYEPALKPGTRISHLLPRWLRSSTLSMYASVLPLVRLLRREKPAVLISFLSHTTVVAHLAIKLSGFRGKFVVGLQNNPTRDLDLGTSPFATLYRKRIVAAYAAADHFIALSRGVAGDFLRLFPERKGSVETIYNAGFEASLIERGNEPLVGLQKPDTHPLLVACGRLTPQKNYPLLLRAVAKIPSSIRPVLWILGAGELKADLEALARELGILDQTFFLGFQKNPHRFMKQADVFVLSSDWEGFGNVVVEAMALGLPVISTACPFGPSEIIENERNGLLVPVNDVNALADAIERVVTDRVLADRLGACAAERARDFCSETTGTRYTQVLGEWLGVSD